MSGSDKSGEVAYTTSDLSRETEELSSVASTWSAYSAEDSATASVHSLESALEYSHSEREFLQKSPIDAVLLQPVPVSDADVVCAHNHVSPSPQFDGSAIRKCVPNCLARRIVQVRQQSEVRVGENKYDFIFGGFSV